MSPCHVTMTCHHVMSSCLVTISCHHVMSWHRVMTWNGMKWQDMSWHYGILPTQTRVYRSKRYTFKYKLPRNSENFFGRKILRVQRTNHVHILYVYRCGKRSLFCPPKLCWNLKIQMLHKIQQTFFFFHPTNTVYRTICSIECFRRDRRHAEPLEKPSRRRQKT